MSDALVNGLAGACGGIIATICTYPLQAVNTRQQTERKLKDSHPRENQPLIVAGRKKSLSSSQEIWEVFQKEGLGGIYRGLPPSLVGTAISQGVYYYFYQVFRNRAQVFALRRKALGLGNGSVGMFSSLVIAALAGCCNVLLTNPIWVIVTRMQTQSQLKSIARINVAARGKQQQQHSSRAAAASLGFDAADGKGSPGVPPHGAEQETALSVATLLAPVVASPEAVASSILRPKSTIEMVADLYQEAGIRGFWKGVVPTLVMVSNPALQFAIYEGLLARVTAGRLAGRGGARAASALEVFGMGAVAKLGATVVTYPLLVVKSRLQAKQEIGGDINARYSGTVDAIAKMVQHEGVAGFYKGMGTKIVQSVLAAALLFMTKEELVKFARLLVARRRHVSAAAAALRIKPM
eukprot:jgi/Mesen1/8458/ME000476S07992